MFDGGDASVDEEEGISKLESEYLDKAKKGTMEQQMSSLKATAKGMGKQGNKQKETSRRAKERVLDQWYVKRSGNIRGKLEDGTGHSARINKDVNLYKLKPGSVIHSKQGTPYRLCDPKLSKSKENVDKRKKEQVPLVKEDSDQSLDGNVYSFIGSYK